jgi:hypothetical protein
MYCIIYNKDIVDYFSSGLAGVIIPSWWYVLTNFSKKPKTSEDKTSEVKTIEDKLH